MVLLKELTSALLFLGPHVKVVEGRRSSCVIDLEQGDYVLANRSAGRILLAFEGGKMVSSVLAKCKVPKSSRNETLAFIDEALTAGLLKLDGVSESSSNSTASSNPHISRSILSVSIELTKACNLRCLHCYNDSGPQNSSELGEETVCRVLSELATQFRDLGTLTLTGGETLLYKSLPRVIRRGLESGFARIRINTNGTIRPWKELISVLGECSSELEIQVTLLGANATTHDKVAGRRGAFFQTVEGIRWYVDRGLPVYMAFIKSMPSRPEMDEAESLAKELGVNLVFGDIYPLGRALRNREALDVIPERTSTNFLCESRRFGDKATRAISDEKRDSMLEKFPPRLPCGRNTFAFTSDGDVLPCALLPGMGIGNIHRESISEIASSSRLLRFLHEVAIENRQVCCDCELRYVCANKCPAVSRAYTGSVQSKSPFCNYY